MQNIVTLGEINDALKFTTVNTAQLAGMGFAPLDNKPICEALPTEQSRRLRNAKLYPAESVGQIRIALAQRLAAPAACLHQIQEPAPVQAAQPSDKDLLDVLGDEIDSSDETFIGFGRAVLAKFGHLNLAAPAAVAVRDAEKLLRAEAARLARIYGSNKWYGFSAEKASHLEHLRVADALAATPADHVADAGKMVAAAAPVVLPEPVMVVSQHTIDFLKESLRDCDDSERDVAIGNDIEKILRALLATATAPTEPFGYFKAEPFGWTDCGPDDEGAVALYEKPQAMLAIGGQAQAVPHQQLTSEIELVLSDQDSKLSPGAQRALKWCLTWVSVPLQLAAPQAQAVGRGEVLVTVSGFTGSGKSAIAGEIEILCRALGLQVEWPDGESEKNMTHADWTAALEQYKPRVRIVEQNIPFVSKKGLSK